MEWSHFIQFFFQSDFLAFMNVLKKNNICLLLALGHTDPADFLHPSSWFGSHLPTSPPAWGPASYQPQCGAWHCHEWDKSFLLYKSIGLFSHFPGLTVGFLKNSDFSGHFGWRGHREHGNAGASRGPGCWWRTLHGHCWPTGALGPWVPRRPDT